MDARDGYLEQRLQSQIKYFQEQSIAARRAHNRLKASALFNPAFDQCRPVFAHIDAGIFPPCRPVSGNGRILGKQGQTVAKGSHLERIDTDCHRGGGTIGSRGRGVACLQPLCGNLTLTVHFSPVLERLVFFWATTALAVMAGPAGSP